MAEPPVQPLNFSDQLAMGRGCKKNDERGTSLEGWSFCISSSPSRTRTTTLRCYQGGLLIEPDFQIQAIGSDFARALSLERAWRSGSLYSSPVHGGPHRRRRSAQAPRGRRR